MGLGHTFAMHVLYYSARINVQERYCQGLTQNQNCWTVKTVLVAADSWRTKALLRRTTLAVAMVIWALCSQDIPPIFSTLL